MTPSEAKRHFVYIERENICEFFPCPREPFKIRIGDKEFEVEIDNENRIWAALFRDYVEFNEGNVFVFRKNRDDSFTLSLEK